MTDTRHAGRPPGPEPTSTITVRLPDSLNARLDRHLDLLEIQTGIKANRGTIARHALKVYLDAQDNAPAAPGHRTTRPGKARSYGAPADKKEVL